MATVDVGVLIVLGSIQQIERTHQSKSGRKAVLQAAFLFDGQSQGCCPPPAYPGRPKPTCRFSCLVVLLVLREIRKSSHQLPVLHQEIEILHDAGELVRDHLRELASGFLGSVQVPRSIK